ncbi:hypothetical protein RD792_006638 [Penstemon davidsonii]|uniref:Protein FAR1-RELATED SEQUENCE n=1 Tax=Penstemon davidsonii TaxID=160366 RepID=A0ABR0DC36_9LAMI|nr:hypothetical protein RD792_006638 [Penstemon davidsonii]
MDTNVTPQRRLDFDTHDENQETEFDYVQFEDGEKFINERYTAISNDKIPQIGMKFESEEAAYKFYNEYAKIVGFSIRKHVAHKHPYGVILDRVFCCSCQGQRGQDKRDATIRSHCPETRKGCLAMMKINARQTGKYTIQKFIAAHNDHGLASPNKSHMLRSHRIMSVEQAHQANDIYSSGITPKAGFELMAKQMGGRENVGFIFDDYKNYLRSKRTVEMKKGDTGGVLEYLQQRQLEDPNFFYAIQVDQDDLIANIFLADSQMMADFAHFGDVVCFYTTYRKCRDGRPFALFVGVNHHKQTSIFGAALLYDETADTFMAMSGEKPQLS